jgi:hypothetical protein
MRCGAILSSDAVWAADCQNWPAANPPTPTCPSCAWPQVVGRDARRALSPASEAVAAAAAIQLAQNIQLTARSVNGRAHTCTWRHTSPRTQHQQQQHQQHPPPPPHMSMDVVMQCLGGAGSSSSSSHAAGAAGQLPSKSEASLARGTAPSPRAPAAGAQQPTPQQPTQQQHHHHHRVYVSPPCCSGCGAAKASGGICSGCGGAFCRACMGLPATASSNSNSNAPDCANCSSLCSSCKPVACCFCEEMREQAGPVRMCEACAGTCDVCQRAACGACRWVHPGCCLAP